MANVNVNTSVLNEAAASLRNTAEILELQENTLNEVAALIENAWRSRSTGELVDCAKKIRKNVNKVENALRSSARSLSSAAKKAKDLEAANAALADK